MPIYEFYCADCHTIFNFFSRRVDTTTRPACPRCGRPKIERQVSRFATAGKSTERDRGDDLPDGIDESKMESALEAMSREADGLDESNPRQVAQMLRRLQEMAGLPLGDKAQEAIRRMESGESPEKIEEEMGDVFSEAGADSDLASDAGPAGPRRKTRRRPPAVDDKLYDL